MGKDISYVDLVDLQLAQSEIFPELYQVRLMQVVEDGKMEMYQTGGKYKMLLQPQEFKMK